MKVLFSKVSSCTCDFAAIKQTMQKDVDVVGKIARTIKAKIEQLDREARQYIY